ncbi:hypothetical protein [Methanothrix sp.]|uniref:hypothetical protein n=1 Tax=Methanothrix sp. TaxID=90426 RepID=UPI00345E881A
MIRVSKSSPRKEELQSLAERVSHCPNYGMEMDGDLNARPKFRTPGRRGKPIERCE